MHITLRYATILFEIFSEISNEGNLVPNKTFLNTEGGHQGLDGSLPPSLSLSLSLSLIFFFYPCRSFAFSQYLENCVFCLFPHANSLNVNGEGAYLTPNTPSPNASWRHQSGDERSMVPMSCFHS
jgi:hypothetical protein